MFFVRRRLKLAWILSPLFLLAGCLAGRVQKDLVVPPDFRPQEYRELAVINMDAQVNFSPYVEAELLRKGYHVKEGSAVRQLLKKEGFSPENGLDPAALSRIGENLKVQGIVLCSVLEFSRFRDAYRISIRMVAPPTGNTVWAAQGAMEGRKGQKTSELLREIVIQSLKGLPPAT